MTRIARKVRCAGRPMTVLVLAGGRGLRMRADKALLRVGGERLVERVLRQVRPLFDEVLVCVSRGRRLPFLRDAQVEDERAGEGPLGAVRSGLRAARHDACAVVACDIPDVEARVLRRLARAAAGCDIAVPIAPGGHFEPLFAVYRKAALPAIERLLASGGRGLIPLFDRRRTAVVPLRKGERLRNLNTRADLRAYLRGK